MTDNTRVDSQAIDCRNRRMALHMRVAALIVFIAVAVTAAPPSPLHEAMARVQSVAAVDDHPGLPPPPRAGRATPPPPPAGRGRPGGQAPRPPYRRSSPRLRSARAGE